MNKLETGYLKPINNNPENFLKREEAYLGRILKKIDKNKSEENTLFKISRQTMKNGRKERVLTNSVWVKYENGSRRLFNVNHGKPVAGAGGYKVVKKITERETNRDFALGQYKLSFDQTIKLYDSSQQLPDSFENHKYLLSGKVDKVIKLRIIDNKLKAQKSFATFSELYEGDLLKLQNEINSSKMLAQLFFRMTASVIAIHTEGYCHRDVKINNWLYRIEGDHIDLKLMDYDLAIPLYDKSQGAVPTKWAGTRKFLPENIEGNWKEINVGRYHQKFIDYYALYMSMHLIFKHVSQNISISEDLKKIDEKLRISIRSIDKDSQLDDLYKLPIPNKFLDDFNAFIQRKPPQKPVLTKNVRTRLASKIEPDTGIDKTVRTKKETSIATRNKNFFNQGIGKRQNDLNSNNHKSVKPPKKIAKKQTKQPNPLQAKQTLNEKKRFTIKLDEKVDLPKKDRKKPRLSNKKVTTNTQNQQSSKASVNYVFGNERPTVVLIDQLKSPRNDTKKTDGRKRQTRLSNKKVTTKKGISNKTRLTSIMNKMKK